MNELTTAITALHQDLEGLRTDLAATKLYGRNSRLRLRLVVISLVLDVCLSLGLGLVALNTRELATKNTENARLTCLSSNDARKAQIELWKTVFALPAAAPKSPSDAKDYQGLLAYIQSVFAPRNCG